MPDPLESPTPATGRLHVGLQHLLDRRAQQQIRKPDDPGAHLSGAVVAARTHRRDAVHELRLAHWAQLHWTSGTAHGSTFEKHRLGNGVAAVQVRQQLVQQVARVPVWDVPQMMMRVHNRQVRLQDLLVPLGQPRLIDGRVHAVRGEGAVGDDIGGNLRARMGGRQTL